MTLLQRRPREVYRVYGEHEYLAGADPFADCGAPVAELKQGRSLQRFAGVAALTGAVGTVGGVIGLAGLHAHSVDRREISERVVPSMRMAVSRTSASAEHVTLRQLAHRSPPRRRHAARPVQIALVPRRTERHPAVRTPARTPITSTPQDTPAPTASSAQAPSAEAESRPRTQSEFGFER